jgi:hypothetical protein
MEGAIHSVAGVVNENVHTAEGSNGLLRHRGDLIRFGYIERQAADAVWILPHETRQLRDVACCSDHSLSPFQRLFGKQMPESCGCSGNKPDTR